MATTLPDSVSEALIAVLAPSGGTIYLSLHSADPGKTGANEISGTGYVRVAIAVDTDLSAAGADAPSGGRERHNTADVDFGTAGSAWGPVSHVGVHDALSGGNFKGGAALTTPQTVASGNPVKFAAGDLVLFGAGAS